MKPKKSIAILILAILILPTTVFGLNFEAGEEIFNSKTINDDYYGAGKTIHMESDVNGDLIMAGGRIMVNSIVSQDLILAGGEITIRGEINDDARILGGNVMVNAIIKDDLIIGGGNIEVGDKSFVGGNLVFGGGNIIINGPINGDVLGAGGSVYINSAIMGNVKLHSVNNVRFGPLGKVWGDFSYRSHKESDSVNKSTVSGNIEYKPTEISVSDKDIETFFKAILAGFSVLRLLAILFTGLFLVWIFRFYLINTVETSYKNALKSFGVGLLLLTVTPIVALITLLTGIGMYLSYILILFWLLIMTISKIIAALIVGMKILPVKTKSGFLRIYVSFAIGAFILAIFSLIPIIGWIIEIMLVMIGAGALLLYGKKLFRLTQKERKA